MEVAKEGREDKKGKGMNRRRGGKGEGRRSGEEGEGKKKEKRKWVWKVYGNWGICCCGQEWEGE